MTQLKITRRTAWLLPLVVALGLSGALLAQQDTKIPDAENLVGRPAGTPLAGDALTRRTQEIASSIRCPVCQGLSITDSPAEMAQNMRGQVRALLARGYTEPQILSYFERSYGQFVLLRPRFQGINALVWLLPLAVLVGGAAIVFVKLRRMTTAPGQESGAVQAGAPASGGAQASAEDPYLARVRNLVKGDE